MNLPNLQVYPGTDPHPLSARQKLPCRSAGSAVTNSELPATFLMDDTLWLTHFHSHGIDRNSSLSLPHSRKHNWEHMNAKLLQYHMQLQFINSYILTIINLQLLSIHFITQDIIESTHSVLQIRRVKPQKISSSDLLPTCSLPYVFLSQPEV